MKHAERMVVISEAEYTKLNSKCKKRKNHFEDNKEIISKTARPCSTTRKRTTTKTDDKREKAARRQAKSLSNPKISSGKAFKSSKQRKKDKKVAERLLWIKKDVSRKIKQNLIGADLDNDTDLIAPPVQESIAIESFFKPQYRSLVSAILTGLKQVGMKLKDDYNVQLPYGDTIPGSNIVQLMKELVTGRGMAAQRPIGWKSFLPLVAQTSTPLEMFTKSHVRSRIAKIRNELPWEEY